MDKKMVRKIFQGKNKETLDANSKEFIDSLDKGQFIETSILSHNPDWVIEVRYYHKSDQNGK